MIIDGAHALVPDEFAMLIAEIRRLAEALGRPEPG